MKLFGKQICFVEKTEFADIRLKFLSELDDTFVIESAEKIVISADNPLIAFRGMMYVVQQVKIGRKIQSGKFCERLTDRIIMLDIGRKYFSLPTLCQILEQMALYGFNFLQLHFSENEGFRIESEKYPQLVSENFLTKNEIKELIAYATFLSIEIIPDIDTPGHMDQLLKEYPEWQLTIEKSQMEIAKVPSALDITNEEAVAFVLSLYDEYLTLFEDSRYFHIGADEFIDFNQIKQYPSLADEGIKKVESYVNTIANFVKARGFTPRVWNDAFFRKGKTSTLTKEVEITYWTKWQKEMAPLQIFLDEGYSVINFNDNYLYYVLGENAGYTYPTAAKIKQQWHPNLFSSGQQVPLENQTQMKGAALAVWCDKPAAKTEKDIVVELTKLMEGFSSHFHEIK
ncbi:hypothetical protein RU98_GL000936 [Enterococcus caccae]|nr:hypothetical protein RU98_GL000936 [Enterococcus caccae]